jgi:molybdopterin converting factor small subunit
MNVTLFLSAHLRDYVPGFDPGTGLSVPVEEGSTVRELALRLGIPMEKVKLIFVDGLHASWDRRLKGGERINLFPPVAGG